MADRIALIAGTGALPQLVAQQCTMDNRDICVIALHGFTDPSWVALYPHHVWVRLGQIGAVLTAMKKWRCTDVVMAGAVRRPSWAQIRPDWMGFKLLWQLRAQPRGDDALLRFLSQFFVGHGYRLVGADTILPQSLMPRGVMTARQPDQNENQDIAYGLDILKPWAAMDQGQSIVVQQGLILGVEAIEGTDALIARSGTYQRDGQRPILLKIKKPLQDRRLDLPTIGVDTVQNTIDAGFAGIAVQAQCAIFLQPSEAVTLADRHGLFIVGIDV